MAAQPTAPHPVGVTEKDVRTAVLKNSDERLKEELKRAKPGVDPKVIDDMTREDLVKEIVKLRIQMGTTTMLRDPVEEAPKIEGAIGGVVTDPTTLMMQMMQMWQREQSAKEEARLEKERAEKKEQLAK